MEVRLAWVGLDWVGLVKKILRFILYVYKSCMCVCVCVCVCVFMKVY